MSAIATAVDPSAPMPGQPPPPPPPAKPYRRGTPATCGTCGITGHRTELCIAHRLPHVIVHTTGRRKQRLQDYFSSSPLYRPYSVQVVEAEQEGALVFLRCNDASAVLHTAQLDSVINRYIYAVYIVHNTTRHTDRLLLHFAPYLPPNTPSTPLTAVRVQCYPKDRTEEVIAVLNAGGVVADPRQFSHVFFALFAYGRWNYALETGAHHYVNIHQRLDANISHTSASTPESPPEPGREIVVNGSSVSFETVVSRAYYKLKEVFQLEPDLRLQPGARAIDLGGAPGGWTSFLAAQGCSLVASVDPGELHISITPNIVHLQKKAELAVAELSSMAPFHCLVCDMNTYSLQSIRLCLTLLPLLTPRAPLVLTVKELQSGHGKKLQAGAMELLAVGWEGLHARFLMSNGRERTVVGWRRERRAGEEAEVAEVLARIERLVAENDARVKEKFDKRKDRGLNVGGKLGKKALRKAIRGGGDGTTRNADRATEHSSTEQGTNDDVVIGEFGE